MSLPLFLALDVESRAQALDLFKKSKDYVQGFKIGPRLFLKYGPSLIEEIKSRNPASQIFLDFKFYDIPSSTWEAVRSAFEVGADFVTVHAGVGEETLRLLSKFEKKAREKRFFQVLCVTVLSSESSSKEQEEQVLKLADKVYQSGLRGLVCSPKDLKILKNKYRDLYLVTPGIRFEGEDLGDQKRVMTPEEALRLGSSALVMGRSLIREESLEEKLNSLYQSLKSFL